MKTSSTSIRRGLVRRFAVCLSVFLLVPALLRATPPAGYSLAWEDQFTGTSLNQDWWNILTGAYNGATRTTDAVTVANGYLTLATYTENDTHYTGFVSTRDKLQPRYGYIEISMESIVASGVNHAFWLQSPTNGTLMGNPWDAGIEIDIVEHRYSASGANNDKATGAIHWDGYDEHLRSTGSGLYPSGLHTGFHTYGLEWTPTQLKFYVDNVLVWTVTNSTTPVEGDATQGVVPLRSEYIYLTASVSPFSTSGAFAGFPLPLPGTGYGNRTASTTKMRVDYVKVYQLSSTTLPDVPTELVASSGNNSVDLRWTLSANAETHNIKRSTTRGSGYQTIASGVKGTRYTDSTAASGTTYYYVVSAVRTVGSSTYESTNSNEAIASPAASIPVFTVDNTQVSAGDIVGTWSSSSATGCYLTDALHDGNPADSGDHSGTKSVRFVPGTFGPATSYEVHLWWVKSSNRAIAVPVEIVHAGGTSTVYVDQTQNGGAWYQLGTYTFNATGASVRVRNNLDNAHGFVSADAVQFRQLALPPPTGLTAAAVSNTQVDLAWTAAVGATSYTVKRSTTSGSGYTNIASNVTGLTYMDTGRTPNTKYYYVVTAVRGTSTSANSAQASATTPIIMDNTDGGVVQSPAGSWTAATATGGYYGTNYLHDGDTRGNPLKSVTYTTPTIATTGSYEAWARWTAHSNRASNARIDVVHAGGTTTYYVDQTTNNGTWVRLGTGTFTLNSGQTGKFIVRNNSANGYVVADAVKFVRQ